MAARINRIPLLVALTIGFSTLHAEPMPPPAPLPGMNPALLIDTLGLDESQAAAAVAIFEESRARHDQERSLDRKTNCAIEAEADARFVSLLSDEQVELFEQLKKEWAERRPPPEPPQGEPWPDGAPGADAPPPPPGPQDCFG